MLSAQKDANGATQATPTTSSASRGAVGRVVNSIQGLQQRLNDYSLEEVAEAESRSRSLLLGLSNLQARVESLATVKRRMADVGEAIEQERSEESILSTILDTSDKPLHLHEIVQASNLIRFPRLKKISNPASNHFVHAASVTNQILTLAEDRPNSTDTLEAPPAADSCETNGCLEEPPFVFETTEIEPGDRIPAADFSWDEESGGMFHKNSTDEVRYNNEEIQTTETNPPAEISKGIDFSMSAAELDPVVPPAEPTESISTALVPTGGDFDQRLLDDLIKNYGEFFSSSDSRSKHESKTNPKTRQVGSEKTYLQASDKASAKDNTARTAPFKKEGDIDRELKKIIKDYGEYDIYSSHSPINLKFAVIGAFLLLAAVVSGFYFLWSPKSQGLSSLPAAAAPASTTWDSDTTGIPELKRASEANGTKHLNKSPIVKK